MEEGKGFALCLTWNGKDPALKSILLNSHMDVVEVDPEKWKYPPFDAFKDENDNIYARGASDMKSSTVAKLEAIKKLKQEGFVPLRTIYITVMPDEEKGGGKGMKFFVKSEYYRKLNVALDIDEGGINDGVSFGFKYAEKSVWQFNITARGVTGHGSMLPKYTASHRLQHAINLLFNFRHTEYQRLERGELRLEDITTINLAKMGGGVGDNVIPEEVWASFDLRIRIRPDWNFTHVENMLNDIISEARLGSTNKHDVTLHYIVKSMEAGETVANDSSVWWKVLQSACREMNVKCKPTTLSGATDGRYLRALGIPVFGFCPFLKTPPVAHQINEFINESEFLNGIEIYKNLIKHLAMVPSSISS